MTPGMSDLAGTMDHMGAVSRSRPVTILTLSTDPPAARHTAVLRGHFPDLLATITTALDKAAEYMDPARCEECWNDPGPCEHCCGDEELVRRFRALHEALTAAPRAALNPGASFP